MFGMMRRMGVGVVVAGVLTLALAPNGRAQADTQNNAAPAAQSAPTPAPSAAPAGPAAIRLAVDATQAPQKILHAHMQIPVQAGALTLQYPEWIPGEHMPDGPIINVACKFHAFRLIHQAALRRPVVARFVMLQPEMRDVVTQSQ